MGFLNLFPASPYKYISLYRGKERKKEGKFYFNPKFIS